MRNTVYHNQKPICYEITGKGYPIVLLHGYLESLEIWGDFRNQLAKDFLVVTIDLPGFGLSGTFSHIHTMEFFAEATLKVAEDLKIDKFILVGHSLGGYVSLAILENYPHLLKGLCLFHSHPYPDSEQTIEKRKREIELVKTGKQELIFNINIPNAFSPANIEKMLPAIAFAKSIASTTQSSGIIAALNGMMCRPLRAKVLKETGLPVLLILGKNDNYIPFDGVGMKIELTDKGRIFVLEHSGHMGFLEEPDLSVSAVSEFGKSLL